MKKKILKKLPEFGNQIGVSKTLLIISGLRTLGRCVYTNDDGYIQYMNFFKWQCEEMNSIIKVKNTIFS